MHEVSYLYTFTVDPGFTGFKQRLRDLAKLLRQSCGSLADSGEASSLSCHNEGGLEELILPKIRETYSFIITVVIRL